MRTLRLLFWVVLVLACGSAQAQVAAAPDPASSHSVPPLPRTALGAEPVGNSTPPTTISSSSGPAAQPEGLDYPRVLAALGIVIALIFVLRWFSRFFFPAATGRGRSRAVEVLSRSPLSPKQQVMLLRVGQRLIVVGDSGAQMNPLCQITDPDEVAALIGQLRDEKLQIPKRAFGGLFGRSQQAFEADDPTPPHATTSDLRETGEDDPPVATAREELSGLRERVRLLAEQFKGG